MIISVTQKHIENGFQSSCNRCPIALAIADAIPDTYVSVSNLDIQIGKSSDAFYRMPRSCVRFIRKFDFGEPVQPFKFRLVKESA